MSTIQVPFDPETLPATGEGIAPLPEGYYHLRAVKQEYVPPKGPDSSAAIVVYWEVIETETGIGKGRERRNRFSLSAKAASAFLRPFLQAAGVHFDEIAHPSGQKVISFDPEHILGTVVRAKTNHSTGQDGKVWNDWAAFSVSQYAPQQGARQAGFVGMPQPQQPMAPQGSLPPPGMQFGQGQGQAYGQPPPGYGQQQMPPGYGQAAPQAMPQTAPQQMPPPGYGPPAGPWNGQR